jgi:hypothetical protein
MSEDQGSIWGPSPFYQQKLDVGKTEKLSDEPVPPAPIVPPIKLDRRLEDLKGEIRDLYAWAETEVPWLSEASGTDAEVFGSELLDRLRRLL